MWDTILVLYKFGGSNAVRRALTPPKSFVEKVCKRTGADVAKAMEERNEALDEILEFLDSLVDADFEDPDPAT